MKRNMMHWMFAAAALAVAAGSASAQTLKAEIPFSFRAGGVLMPPGDYSLTRSSSGATSTFIVYNPEIRKSVILAHYVLSDAAKAWRVDGSPRLGFECAATKCVLRSIYTATDSSAYILPGPKPAADEPMHVAEVRMTPVKSE